MCPTRGFGLDLLGSRVHRYRVSGRYQIGLVNREEAISVFIGNRYRDWLSEKKYVVNRDDLFEITWDATPDTSPEVSREASRDASGDASRAPRETRLQTRLKTRR